MTRESHPLTFGQFGTLKVVPPPRPPTPGRRVGGLHITGDIMHLVECIEEDRDPVVSGERAAHVIEIIDKGYQSAQCGRALQLVSTF